MLSILRDARYCIRSLSKAPGFTAVVILTLALGIGANTAIFSIVDAVLLRPLAFPDPDRLVRVVENAPGLNLRDVGMSVPDWIDLRDNSGIFQDISVVWPIDGNITGAGKPQRVEFLAVSFNYFNLLGAHPYIGRLIGPQDSVNGFSDAAVISYSFWQRSFGGDRSVLGRRFREDGDAYTIVGVMPPDFRHPGRTLDSDIDGWAATTFIGDPFPATPIRSANFLPGSIGRLKPGMSLREAQSRLDAFAAQLHAKYPNDYNPQAHFTIQMEPLKESLTGNVRALLLTLLGAVAMMLVIGCVNIANLLLVRAAGRQREMSIRQSLGASRARLIRQMLTESVILALAAGVVGVGAAALTLRLLLQLAPARLPRISEIAIDGRVLWFAIGVCLVTGILFGLAPALQTAAFDLASRLKETGRGGGSGRRQARASAALVTTEFAICLMLMTGAGLLVRSFWNLTHTDPGFNPKGAIAARIWLPQPNDPRHDPYGEHRDRLAFIDNVLRRVHALPGVSSAAMSTGFPMGARETPQAVTMEGRAVRAENATLAEAIFVTPEYFRVLGTPMLEGRMIADSDRPGQTPVVVVDHTTAARFWPGQSALGKRIKLGTLRSGQPWATVIGVVRDIRHDGLDQDGVPHIYYSLLQQSRKVLAVELRSEGDPARLGEALAREIQAVDPNLPVFGVATFENMMSRSLAQRRFSAELMGTFALLALLLAAMGIYGVLAYFVGQRTREIGVRMALGAEAGRVVGMVLRQGLRPIALGMVLGVAGSVAFVRLLSGLLYGVSSADPLVLVAVPLTLVAAAVLASAVPAWRATRIDPMAALRYD